MKVLFFTLFTICAVTSVANAQELSKKFAKITQADIDFQYEKDQEADAVVLFDFGETHFQITNEGLVIRFTRTRRIKILNKAGVEHAEVSIPYYVDGYGKTEQIKELSAHTFNYKNNKLAKQVVLKGQVFEEKINDTWSAKKFTFPDVQPGSIIEYTYQLISPFHFNLPDWEFQDKIPTLHSEYNLRLVPFYEYQFIAQGITKFDEYDTKVMRDERRMGNVTFIDTKHKFVMRDIPAFEGESYITSSADYIQKLDFQLAKVNNPNGGSHEVVTTWEKMNSELLKHADFGKYVKKSRKMAEKIFETELKLDDKSDVQKVKAIVDYVKGSFRWDGYYGKYTRKPAKAFITQKTGSASNINLFLVGMLQAAGFNAKPVILSTREHGKIRIEYPFSHMFNYVIVFVEMAGKPILTDGTETLLGYNKIPTRCINEIGLIVDESVEWVRLDNNIVSKEKEVVDLHFDLENNIVNSAISVQATEFDAYLLKKKFNDNKEGIKASLLDNGFESVEKVRTMHFSKSSVPYVIAYKGTMKPHIVAGNILIAPFLNFPMQENKLRQKTRKYPVDLIYAQTKEFQSVIHLPDGYKVMSIPKNFTMNNDLVEIRLVFNQYGRELQAEGSYTFKKPVYQPSEYAKIKSYMRMIVKKFNEQIVLQKAT